MDQKNYQAQMKALESVSQKALKSKEAALKFLIDAGIIKPKPGNKARRLKKTL